MRAWAIMGLLVLFVADVAFLMLVVVADKHGRWETGLDVTSVGLLLYFVTGFLVARRRR
jgi:hypothetical protein